MRTEITPVRLKILLCILKMEKNQLTAANIAKHLKISKSTVSRAADSFSKERILYEKELKFTPYGEKWIKRYERERETLQKWFVNEGEMSLEQAEEQALLLLISSEPKTRGLLIENLTSTANKNTLEQWEGFLEKSLDHRLLDGKYTISYTLCKDDVKEHLKVSPMNEAFQHPAALSVGEGEGMVFLNAKLLVRPVSTGKGMLYGQVQEASYLMNQEFCAAKCKNNVWSFPASCMKFTFNKGEHVLLGSAVLKLKCFSENGDLAEDKLLFAVTLVL